MVSPNLGEVYFNLAVLASMLVLLITFSYGGTMVKRLSDGTVQLIFVIVRSITMALKVWLGGARKSKRDRNGQSENPN
jgi:hypothetical protein